LISATLPTSTHLHPTPIPFDPQTYLAGESYAGQYIPYIAQAILETTRLPTRLMGIMIGNGWIDPWNQYPAYYEFALEAGILKEGSDTDKSVRKEVENCMANMRLHGGPAKLPVHLGVCERILGAITDSTIQSCVPVAPFSEGALVGQRVADTCPLLCVRLIGTQCQRPEHVRQQLRRPVDRHAPFLRYELAARHFRHHSLPLGASIVPFLFRPPKEGAGCATFFLDKCRTDAGRRTACSQRDDVKSAFHATRHAGAWTECNGQVGANFYTPHSLPSVTLLPDLLTKIQVLMFAGAEDLICVRAILPPFPFLSLPSCCSNSRLPLCSDSEEDWIAR
jgi:hypothetical protein